jgi:hypothetical protein
MLALLRLGLFCADPIWKPTSTYIHMTDLTMTSPISNGHNVAVKLDAGGFERHSYHGSMPLGVNMIYEH